MPEQRLQRTREVYDEWRRPSDTAAEQLAREAARQAVCTCDVLPLTSWWMHQDSCPIYLTQVAKRG